MNNFLNDYNDLGHERIYKNILDNIDKNYSGYGYDEVSQSARELIRNEIGKNVDIEFVSGGTIANILAITFGLRKIDAVLTVESGHIVHHETGSIEATGHKVVTVKREDGKIRPSDIIDMVKRHSEEIDVNIKLVYISNTTELGTVYTKDELKEIYKTCKELNLYLYIDGARLAVAMSAVDLKLSDMAEVSDIFTVGGTKNGAIYGEAVIIVNEDLKKYFRYFMKQRGAIMAKTFVIGMSFKTLFENSLYYELGEISYEKSRKLIEGLNNINREVLYKGESNQIFIKSSEDEIKRLKENNLFEVNDSFENIIRFVTNYRTTDEEIDALIKDLKN